MTITYNHYCQLRDGLIEFLNRGKVLKRYRLTPQKIIAYNLIADESLSKACIIHKMWKSGVSVEYLANKLIFWKYDSYETVYEDYNYTFQRILEKNPEKRWLEFKKIYCIDKCMPIMSGKVS